MEALSITPKTLFKVGHESERNGRDDSDWYCLTYDPTTDEIHETLVGTTRGAMEWYRGVDSNTPDEVWARAAACFIRKAVPLLISYDNGRKRSEAKRVGCNVVLTQDVKNRPREEYEEPCDRCGGEGCWINPRNPVDKRECFGCHGTKMRKRTRATKGAAVVVPAGTKAQVTGVYERKSQYGTWSYGVRVSLRKLDGSTFMATSDAIEADRETMTEAEATRRAQALADARDFSMLDGNHVLAMFGR